MRVLSVGLNNFRSFQSGILALDTINVLIGQNNSGKSTILRALHLMQDSGERGSADVRAGMRTATVHITFDSFSSWGDPAIRPRTLEVTLTKGEAGNVSQTTSEISAQGQPSTLNLLPAREPDHFVVPYLAKRKVVGYNEDVRSANSLIVSPNLSLLPAKLARIGNPAFPGHHWYSRTCEQILGFVVTAIPSDNGMRPGVYFPDRSPLYIDHMGEGVANIVGLLVDLALSQGKLFLIEEPENDLHPRALKALLDLIVKSSRTNQFVISTHSNVVLRHLGSEQNSRVYNVSTTEGFPGQSKAELVEATPRARINVLSDLGYAFSDLDLWDGWLILEESSAERIIRDYLIPWFAPKLARVRTLAVGGVSQVEPTFDDFHRLVRFTHMEDAYRNATWVRVDGDSEGEKIVGRLRQRYSSWPTDRFGVFQHGQFEHYYPENFRENAVAVLAITDKQERREAKRKLLDDVRAWIEDDRERGRAALSISAREVIDDLHAMEGALR